ncbi:hypothetical protein BB561_000976 [Smittium simulii]|uniref:Uncharacterized protein n=1 Tax=Smittium simulii TaxID=133385 RepID=A0A2T9YWQ5_9FUNG|nr:hypothetical protein BB561_000976 [Smittium simulii]
MSVGTYGSIIFGMSEVRTRPIQIIADKSLRLIANPISKTWIGDLIRQPLWARSSAWISGGTRTTIEARNRPAKSQLILKLYKEKCSYCNANVPETIKNVLLGCGRWKAICAKKSKNLYLRLYRPAINNNNRPLNQAKMQLEINIPSSLPAAEMIDSAVNSDLNLQLSDVINYNIIEDVMSSLKPIHCGYNVSIEADRG